MKRSIKLVLMSGLALWMTACKKPDQQAIPVSEYPMYTAISKQSVLQQRYSAAIQGKQDIQITAQVPGTITELKVNEGDRVKKGQSLFVIDQIPYKAAVQTAKANLKASEAAVATAKLTYDSKKSLFADKVVSEFDLLMSENGLRTAEAQLAQMKALLVNAENNLTYTEVLSPCDGVVGKLPYRVGAYVGPSTGKALTTVSDNSDVYVYISWSERQMLEMMRQYNSTDSTMEKLPEVSLILSDETIYSEKGRIESISGVIDATSGAVSVRCAFSNPNGLLRSGGSGNVLIPYTVNAITVPQSAVFEVQEKYFVYLIKDGKTSSKEISILPINNGKEYILTNGLNEGDKIISTGVGLIREGQPAKAKQ